MCESFIGRFFKIVYYVLGMFRSIIYFKRFCGCFLKSITQCISSLETSLLFNSSFDACKLNGNDIDFIIFQMSSSIFFSPRVKLKALSKTRMRKKYHIIQNNRLIIVLPKKLKILSHLFLSKHYLHRNGINPELKCDIIYVNCRVRIKPSRKMNRLEQLYL